MSTAQADQETTSVLVTVKYGRKAINLFTVGPGDILHDRYVKTGRLYEADVLESCASLHMPGAAIVDVGANIGNHTLFFARVLGAYVFAFEPNPVSHALLGRAIAANRCQKKVRVIQCAAGEVQGEGGVLPGREGNLGGEARFIPGEGSIPLTRVDEEVPVDTPVSIIKVDVEGMELPALRGAEKILTRWRPFIIVEAHDRAHLYQLQRYLLTFGYVFQRKYLNDTYLFGASDQLSRQTKLLEALESSAAN